MKIVFENARKCQQFATVFANLKNFSMNVCIYFKPTGIYIQSMDESHCCLFECNLDSSWFKTYTFDEEKDQACVGMNVNMLNKVLNTWNDTQTLTIDLEPASDKISLSFEKIEDKSGHFDKFFELPLMTIENDLIDVKIFDTLVDLTVESKVFCALISQLMIFNDNLTLTFNEENIECTSSGTEGSMKALINIDDVKEYVITENMTLVQSYSLRYVQLMCQFNKLSTEMQMGFNTDMPMLMKYKLSDNDTNEANESFVRIHLAPKIIDEAE